MLSKNQNLLILSLYLIYIKRKNQLEKEQNLIPMQHIPVIIYLPLPILNLKY